eukprot:25736-Prorocentrum_minimum.AAC.3
MQIEPDGTYKVFLLPYNGVIIHIVGLLGAVHSSLHDWRREDCSQSDAIVQHIHYYYSMKQLLMYLDVSATWVHTDLHEVGAVQHGEALAIAVARLRRAVEENVAIHLARHAAHVHRSH